ncbi:HAD family hydrolase [Melghirimyces algeriensis]|uniref:FMN phosphatase YigB, HAD superfamily n=1 Tax=Melghirimyces algeriensis TaxID=910412 RepID=A0A521FCD9_9BACL|nr:HAD family hydrolase [Melghirimyces algeriensis]SMO93180.1 FMN phosphatase YigB, HAD superfamily [Melghirimyces algeriensis]
MKVCCFDLDGTLLPMDTESFIREYINALSLYMGDIFPSDQLLPLIWDATKTMIENQDETLTNEQVFQQRFLSLSGMKKEEIWPHFDKFYREQFPTLKKYIQPSPISRQIIQAALDRGYRVAVATNPVFPRMAILERMRWAQVEDLVEWVSVYEESYLCKPNPGYFLEVAQKMEVSPEDCVMIGNDVQEDLVAGTVGMKTYLVTDCLIDRGNPVYKPDQSGSLEQLYKDIQEGNGMFLHS